MAKKSHPVVREPSPSSEEEEEERGGEEEDEEEEEEEEEEKEKEEVVEEEEEESEDDEESEDSKAAPAPTSSVRNATSDQVLNSTSDDSGSGSGSETESESDSPSPVKPRPPSGVLKSNLHVKPLASIPIDNAKTEAMAKVKGKGVTSAKAPEPAPAEKTKSAAAAAAAAAKRPSEEDFDAKGSHPKKARTEVLDTAMGNRKNEVAPKPSDDSKRQLFQRLWSEDDEVALLEGVIEFTGKTGAIPSGDMKPFHDFIKKSFHFEASTIQLSEKLRRLKLKYKNNSAKAAKKGAEIKFSKAHDQICYDLSKKVWGNVTYNSEAAEQQTKSNRKASTAGPVAARKGDFGSGSLGGMGIMTDLHGAVVAAGSFGEDILRQGLAHIGDSWSPSFERKWKDLQVEDMKLYLRRIGLIQEMIKLVMDSYYD